MAKMIKVINALRPRIVRTRTDTFCNHREFLLTPQNDNAPTHAMTLESLAAALTHFLRRGNSVNVENVGVFNLRLLLSGEMRIGFTPCPGIVKQLNTTGRDAMTVKNADNIGKTAQELAALWNEAHPEDPAEI